MYIFCFEYHIVVHINIAALYAPTWSSFLILFYYTHPYLHLPLPLALTLACLSNPLAMAVGQRMAYGLKCSSCASFSSHFVAFRPRFVLCVWHLASGNYADVANWPKAELGISVSMSMSLCPICRGNQRRLQMCMHLHIHIHIQIHIHIHVLRICLASAQHRQLLAAVVLIKHSHTLIHTHSHTHTRSNEFARTPRGHMFWEGLCWLHPRLIARPVGPSAVSHIWVQIMAHFKYIAPATLREMQQQVELLSWGNIERKGI